MEKDNKENTKLFSHPRWNEDPGAVPTGETFELTEETKKWVEEQDEKWKKTIEKLKSQRKHSK